MRLISVDTIRKWFLVALAFALFGIFFSVADEIVENDSELISIDRSIMLAFSSFRSTELNNVAIEITSLGSYPVMTIFYFLVVFVLYFNRHWVGLIHAFFAFAGTGILQASVKMFYDRPRPDVVSHLVHVNSSSFPSGHSFAAAAIYLSLALLGAEHFKKKSERAILFSFAAILITLIGLSRIYLGVHYPSDVMSGACIGAAWAFLLGATINWYNGWVKQSPSQK